MLDTLGEVKRLYLIWIKHKPVPNANLYPYEIEQKNDDRPAHNRG